MNPDLGLRVLSSVMDWDDDKAHDQFQRLRLMATLKYDGYRDFEAGVRFTESLASWLQQFDSDQREAAYEFIMTRLVYIGPSEMEKLVGQFYANFVHPELLTAVAKQMDTPRHTLLANEEARERIGRLRRRTLFLGLSDGARVDYIRHQNVGLITNEQVVGSTQLDRAKWEDLLDELRGDLKDDDATFRAVYLIDDFAATGTSFFRLADGKAKGKLSKFATSVQEAQDVLEARIFEDDYQVFIHHYVGTAKARKELADRLDAGKGALAKAGLPPNISTTYGLWLPESLPLDADNPADGAFLALANEYYDDSITSRHTAVGGTADMKLGYGGCALPLILDHNTPNNSMPLLWAETAGSAPADGKDAVPAMRPLFRRRQRHI
ncbi:hypothetical protein ATK17_3775 [Branchiibius hedensis]|uniref:PRTase-CE domain-containing protein n=1 Tax=Branchiibius hedensis TaxID=672460 RepID=A0A2Y9BNT3_9MICO|nr:hypothetical protein [Branchiibius hedensis]PWJ23282.1 hypothetical protein ATK17_3775 [Branchiibius hedensis]SSA58971.1 hypothetical protein SAMN04489750_3775 [Branchiibius hedensis]